MQQIATIERTGNGRESFELRVELDRNAVTVAEIAIEFVHRARAPFLKTCTVATGLQKWHRADE